MLNDSLLPITAAILCDDEVLIEGQLQPYESKADIINLFRSLKNYFAEVIIITANPKKYEDIGVDVVRELLPNRGPLGSIVSSLLVASFDYIFVLPSTTKIFNKSLIDDFVSKISDIDILFLSVNNSIEPKFAIYAKESLNYLEEALFNSSVTLNSIYELCAKNLKIDTIEIKEDILVGSEINNSR